MAKLSAFLFGKRLLFDDFTCIPAAHALDFAIGEVAGFQGKRQFLDARHIGRPHMPPQFLLDIHSPQNCKWQVRHYKEAERKNQVLRHSAQW